jgi:predicted acyltransferase
MIQSLCLTTNAEIDGLFKSNNQSAAGSKRGETIEGKFRPMSEPTPNDALPPAESSDRLVSLDALRGFDMFWIIGAEEIVGALRHISNSGVVGFLHYELTHRPWEGFAFEDLIFPLFVFIVGASLVFSLTKSVERHGKAATCWKIARRALTLYLLGLVCYGGISHGFEHVRLLGVLQRIAICYLATGLLFVAFRTRGLVAACAILLVGYWALMTFVPVPGVGAGNFAEGKNLANYIDSQYLPLWKWESKPYDPEGMLSTLPTIASCLLGVFAGMLLKNKNVGEYRKVFILAAAGAACLAAGFLWGLQFPIIKKIWTSSFVLVAGGYSCLLLALFYLLIDVWKLRRWATPFLWIGVNPITLYLAWDFVKFRDLASSLVGGPVQNALGPYGPLLTAIVAMALVLLLARLMYQKKVFLRV